ncbi:hypothetical protein U2S04_004280 [Escherichia coli]|mgnify:FL=1|uniref:hypothetical protein n=1 Tax=Escherichia coli TaxID=562 RepID=UPI000DE1BF4F|nr:hypothetical protein [Escherichia coli]EFG1287521.1 hypothetical protein [Escherichia coli]EGE3897655.1 hypothetical protein [Escherichia coli]EHW6757462.1 hypothetical protein [Escherichia coli]EKT8257413.1 hypothetical protein [Escherichia coli]EKT9112689.1 hypothetical protein [Escherichia coli]
MSRFRRVNIDGKSITETYTAKVAVKPGELVKLDGGKFAKATSADVGAAQLYIVNPAFHEGKTITDAIAANETVVADYVEQGREFALLVPAAAYVKGAAIALAADGVKLFVAPSEQAAPDPIIAYCQEDVTLGAEDFIRVRVA